MEKEIWENIQNGDHVSFKKLFDSYYQILLIESLHYLNSIEAAEDVTQQLFVKVWEKRKKIFFQGSILSYLKVSIKNACLNTIEKQNVHNRYQRYELDFRPIPNSQNLSDPFLADRIANAIESLPDKCKIVFKKNRFEGLKYKEIADEMNISIKTVENQMGKALSQLRKALKDYLPIAVVLAMSI